MRDKNGVEIREGDRIKTPLYGRTVGVVERKFGRLRITNPDRIGWECEIDPERDEVIRV